MSHDLEPLEPLAGDLEHTLAAHQAGAAAGAAGEEARFAVALCDLAASAEPDAAWAVELEQRLLAHAPGPASTGTARAATPPARHRTPRQPGNRRTPRRPYRRWAALGGVAAALLLGLLLFTPQVQAGVRTLLHLGAVHIAATTPTPIPGSGPTATPLPSVLDLAGETTLADARAQVSFPILLPAYPPDLGPPDHVYVQDLGGPMVVLVWTVPGQPRQVRMSLHELSSRIWLEKFPPHVVQSTTVNGQSALWTDGPYMVQVIQAGEVTYGSRRLVTGHVLIWTSGAITYRLETSLTLADAVRVAQSLR